MRIHIKEAGRKGFFLPIPTWLVCNRLGAKIAVVTCRETLQEQGIDLTYEELCRFLRVFRQVERKYKGLCILDVEEASGDQVKIYL